MSMPERIFDVNHTATHHQIPDTIFTSAIASDPKASDSTTGFTFVKQLIQFGDDGR